jgi:single-stranded DNA-specific DHH superfamily exonuclease
MEKINFIAGSEKKFFDFMGKLTDKDKIALISHNDSDGIASAVIVSKVVGNIESVTFLAYKPDLLGQVIPELKIKKINKVVITDLTVDEEPESIKYLEKFADVLVIDHHRFAQDINSEKTTFIKAHSDFPASYLCYYLFSKIQKVEGWIAALGISADRVDKYHNLNSSKVFEDFGLGEAPKTGYFWKSGMSICYALVYLSGREKEVYDIMMKAKSIDDLDVLDKYASEIQKELDFYLEEFESKHEEFNDLCYFYFKPKYMINSMLINAISVMGHNKTYVIVIERDGKIKVSARRQDQSIDCSRLLKEAVEGIGKIQGKSAKSI